MTNKPQHLRWEIFERDTAHVVATFGAPADRPAAEAEAKRLGFDLQRVAVRAVLDAAAFAPVKPKPDYAARARERARRKRREEVCPYDTPPEKGARGRGREV